MEVAMADKSLIGTDLGTVTFPVERGKVREFANAILDDNPAFQDPQGPAPLTFSMTRSFWPTEGGDMSKININYAMVVHGGQEFEYLGPVRVGDTLTGRSTIADVYEKEGKRGGKMNFWIFETTFANQNGEDVLISRNVLIERGAPS
jgi:N-terminal half of MaoC dehydratase